MKIVIAMLIVALAAGCRSTSSGPSFSFPPDISDICYHTKEQAKLKIQAHGIVLPEGESLTVIKKPGTVKIRGIWAWSDPRFVGYVAGLCYGQLIEVGCNPVTGGEVSEPILGHEMFHYWLFPFGIRNHDTRFVNDAFRWVESERTQARRVKALVADGPFIAVDIIHREAGK
jgi:hypothetical protein